MSQFQLFPPPAPQGVPKNPFRKASRRPSIASQSTLSSPLEDLGSKGAEAKAVLVHVVEPNSIKPPPRAHIPRLPSPSMSKPNAATQSTESLPRSSSPKEDRPKSPPKELGSKSPVTTNNGTEKPTPAQTPVQDISPVVPIRSMFPRFNPNAPLTQQQYYNGISSSFSQPRPRPANLDLSPATDIDQALGPKTVPASVLNFPAGVLDPIEAPYSSSEELRGLWEAANGQRPDNSCGQFRLRLERTDLATFTFGEPESPFYILQTYSTDEISLSRANPSVLNSGIPIMTLKLEDRRRRELPNDGLVSHLFSRLAAMLAIEQAEELSKQHGLSPPDASEVETNALKRAAAQESCKLSWNNSKRLYELQHPSLCKTPALVGAAGIALSPVRSKYTGVLHISVSPPSTDRTSRQPPTILVTAPLPANSLETAQTAATPRTSTLPLTDTDEPLASLDLGTMTLSISATAIANTIPSLYAIDSLVAAILAVAVSDEATNPVLADMKLYNLNQPMTTGQGPTNGPSFTGKLVATLAEREDAEEGTRLVSRIKKSRSPSTSTTSTSEGSRFSRFWPGSKKQKQKQKQKQNTIIEEFDLEKYGRYASGSSKEGEEIPGIARGIMKILFWGVKLAFYGVILAFKILAWLLVNVSKCLVSEKL